MEKSNKMTKLYKRLKRLGFSKSYLKKYILPVWWEDKIAKNKSGYMQVLGILSRYLNISLDSLLNEDAVLEWNPINGVILSERWE